METMETTPWVRHCKIIGVGTVSTLFS